MKQLAVRVMQIGAIAVVLAATTDIAFDLDRFLVPKELVLHLTAVIAGLLTVRGAVRSKVDRLLIIYLMVSAISAAFATNRWLGLRGLAISASAIVLFWAARALREMGLERPLLNAIALAVIVAASIALLQAYGLQTALFASERAPGGTLGNRNFVGHMMAFGLPAVLLAAMNARRWFASVGVAIVFAVLVLTRSRAAWIAAVVVIIVFVVVSMWRRRLGGAPPAGAPAPHRAAVGVSALIGIAAALLIPNALRWRSENPYLDSARGVASYDAGSGRGRLIQYERSLRMAASHPLFGVGPGNWSVEFPRRVPADDRSLNPSEPGMTFNPWPSSDWIAFVAERGFIAAVILALALAGIALGGSAALIATAAGAIVAGLFDAVLLLPAPALLVWMTLGALSAPPPPAPSRSRTWLALAVIVISAVGAARSAAQLVAMHIYATRADRASLERAAAIDPGNYRVQLRLARIGRRTRCEHAVAAHNLFPTAAAARAAAQGCK
jgi:O-antigen ligase